MNTVLLSIFTLENLGDLVMLVLLQAVLGFDNLLYISLESQKAPEDKQSFVRKMGIGLAILFRIILLLVLMQVINLVKEPLFGLDWTGVVVGQFNLHSLIVLVGGIFILYTAIKEIWHMMSLIDHDEGAVEKKPKSIGQVIFWIVLMNLVFSFDSILSAMALSKVFVVMAIAIVIGGLLMIWLADRVSDFLKKNRMYEVLGLFVLFVVGIMLITEGGHLAHLEIAGSKVTVMNKVTFYFIITIMVLIDIVQGRYQRKISKEVAEADELT
ncbi:MAG: putative tellurium resistance membrane protein TerC [Bacteroidia bacterium]|jgi:predicted tellurium resistance membrane protein TerC